MIAGTVEELLARLDEARMDVARIEAELRRRADEKNKDLHDLLHARERQRYDAS